MTSIRPYRLSSLTLSLAFSVAVSASAVGMPWSGGEGGACRANQPVPVPAHGSGVTAVMVANAAVTAVPANVADDPSAELSEPAPIDLALCLDTSSSMSGLIDAAKEKLWAIVNELGRASPRPILRVALLTYGNDGLSPEGGWVSLDVPFTEDLDLLAEHLFALTTNGGTELVGRVVSVAHGQLDWSEAGPGLRMIVVAGNESADQDQVVPALSAVAGATRRDVVVNAIYCGNPEDEIAPGWRDVAIAGHGHFACIDKDNGTVHVETPFDGPMAELSSALNATYLPYGQGGARASSNQIAQDSNAVGLNWAAAAERAITKCSDVYSCASWDLVDASRGADFELADVAEADLPEALKDLSLEQRAAHLERLFAKRQVVQGQVNKLEAQRRAWLDDARAKGLLSDESAFDRAVRDALRAQAIARGFSFAAQPEAPGVDAATGLQPDPSAPAPLGFVGPPTRRATGVAQGLSSDC